MTSAFFSVPVEAQEKQTAQRQRMEGFVDFFGYHERYIRVDGRG